MQSFDQLPLPLLSLNATGLEEQLATRLLQGADRDIIDLNITPVGPRTSGRSQNFFVPSDLERNIYVTSILDSLNGLLGPDVPHLVRRPPCVSSAELGFDGWTDNRPFPEQTAALRSDLFQEFDIIDKERALKLARLYAHSGFWRRGGPGSGPAGGDDGGNRPDRGYCPGSGQGAVDRGQPVHRPATL